MKVMKATLRRLWRLTRATSIVVGLAVMVGLVAGVVSLAAAAPTASVAVLKGVENNVSNVTSIVGTLADAPILRLDNNGTGPALDLQVESGNAPMTVNPGAGKVTNLDADKLDGKDSTAYGVTMKSAHEEIGDGTFSGCTPEGIYSECAPVTVKVPTGEQYYVTVSSSFSVNHLFADTPNSFDVTYCPAIQGGSFGLSCIETGTGATAVFGGVGDIVFVETNGSESAAISGEIGPIPAGTYTFSTAIKVDAGLTPHNQNKAHTTVMVRDASVPGPPIQ
jgi:hypothetical protein